MAVAVQPSSETKKPSQPLGLYAASVVGAIYVLGAAAVVLRLIPELWARGVGPAIPQRRQTRDIVLGLDAAPFALQPVFQPGLLRG